jgi:hypothetical protein
MYLRESPTGSEMMLWHSSIGSRAMSARTTNQPVSQMMGNCRAVLTLEGLVIKDLDTALRDLVSRHPVNVPPQAHDTVRVRYGVVRNPPRLVLLEGDCTDVNG